MLSIFDGIRGIEFVDVLIKLLLTTLCGTAIGLERSSKNRPAGFRTHILVCLGACVAALTGLYVYLGLNISSDISRISSHVITGLGFIGAGTIIITKKMSIKGLTTAAGLWTTGIIGLAIGSGYYEIGIIGAILVLLAETVFSRLGMRIQEHPQYAIEVLYNDKTSLDHVLRFCKDSRLSITNLKIHTQDDDTGAIYSAIISLRGNRSSEEVIKKVQQMPGIISAMGL